MRRSDLSGLDFTDMKLHDAELVACNFQYSRFWRTDLRFARLSAANFDEADLTGADLQKAELRASTFEGADLTDTKLEGADLRDCAIVDEETNHTGEPIASSFRGAILCGTNMIHSKLKNAIFNLAQIHGTDFSHADLRATSFNGADFADAKLFAARLADADLRGASFTDTDLSGLDLTNAKLARTVGVTDEMIRETLVEQESWVASGGQKGQQAVFAGLDLSGRDLSGANLAAANLEAATLVEVNFSGAMLAVSGGDKLCH